MIARFSMRGLRCGPLLMTTSEPLGNAAENAAPSLAANSGVRSTLTIPVTPKRPKSTLRPCRPQTMLDFTVAPGSTSLPGQILTLG